MKSPHLKPRCSPSCLDYARDLIAFDTTSARSNLDLIDYVAAHLSRYAVTCDVLPGVEAGKANLFATIGPADQPGVILSGHSDTVPACPTEWHSDPFTAAIRDQKLYGRGSCDMKGFLATVMAMAPQFQDADLRHPLHIAISHDEEVGCLGVGGLIQHIEDCIPLPLACLVGEPTGMVPVWGHKGKRAVRVVVHGAAGHSSAAQGMSSIEIAAAIVTLIGDMRDQVQDAEDYDHRFDPPATTIQIGVIAGGQALNVRPQSCEFSFEIRTLPHQNGDEILAEIEQRATVLVAGSEFDVTFHEIASFPALAVEEDQAAWSLIAPLVDTQEPLCVSFGTEAGLFRQAGIPSIVIGPGMIDQAHQPDEYIALSQLAACETFLHALCCHLSKVP